MIVTLDDSVWGDGNVDPLDLLSLFSLCAGQRHLLLLNPKSMTQATAWVDKHLHAKGSLRRRVLNIFDENKRSAPNAPHEHARITVVSGGTDWAMGRLHPTEAVRILQRPLKLLVENSRNDGAFILLMAEPADRRRLKDAIQKGWVEFEMGGGLPEIIHRVRRLANAALGDHTTMIERARMWIMVDRDAHPMDRSKESDVSREVQELAVPARTPWPLTVYQLKRRAIENYVPPRTLRDWWCGQGDTPKQKADRAQYVEAFLVDEAVGGLSEKARHSFNMKSGLLRDIPKSRRDEINNKGSTLTDADLDPLFRGLKQPILAQLSSRGFDALADAFSDQGAIDEIALGEEVGQNERRSMLSSLLRRM